MKQTDFATPRSRLNRRKVKGQEYKQLCIQVLETTKEQLEKLAKQKKRGVGAYLDELYSVEP
jgi:hypothetical protein